MARDGGARWRREMARDGVRWREMAGDDGPAGQHDDCPSEEPSLRVAREQVGRRVVDDVCGEQRVRGELGERSEVEDGRRELSAKLGGERDVDARAEPREGGEPVGDERGVGGVAARRLARRHAACQAWQLAPVVDHAQQRARTAERHADDVDPRDGLALAEGGEQQLAHHEPKGGGGVVEGGVGERGVREEGLLSKEGDAGADQLAALDGREAREGDEPVASGLRERGDEQHDERGDHASPRVAQEDVLLLARCGGGLDVDDGPRRLRGKQGVPGRG